MILIIAILLPCMLLECSGLLVNLVRFKTKFRHNQESEAASSNEEWCILALKRLKEASPLALKVSLRSVSRSSTTSAVCPWAVYWDCFWPWCRYARVDIRHLMSALSVSTACPWMESQSNFLMNSARYVLNACILSRSSENICKLLWLIKWSLLPETSKTWRMHTIKLVIWKLRFLSLNSWNYGSCLL